MRQTRYTPIYTEIYTGQAPKRLSDRHHKIEGIDYV